ncbi:MAG: PAS domain-containing sensor histidine kinase [Herpetosiphonaceae bacterium]|nr:PAS domain-containing sensor histidine kinase [Herpetosiphonaceae bacterium]
MWWLSGALLVALLLLGVWALQLRRKLARAVAPPSPPPPAFDKLPGLLQAIGSSLVEGLLIFEADRRISFANPALSEILEAQFDHIINQSLITVLRDYYADDLITHALATGEQQTTTLQPILSQRRLMLTCQPLPPMIGGGVIVVRDLTQLVQLERARRELVANISHELRTPLASIRLLVDTLASDPPPEVARRMVGQINDETEAMTQLLDELRELAQIESGRAALQLEPIDICEVIERAVTRLRPQAERRGLHIDTTCGADLPLVMIDAERIGQVLLNLLHNAIKFTPDGGMITIQVCPATPAPTPRVARELQQVEGDTWVVVAMTDTGIGIPSREIERVFERFYKVDRARTRNSGGTGLGLAIAKHLVERHGGRIWVESREGHGSTFSMLLRAA